MCKFTNPWEYALNKYLNSKPKVFQYQLCLDKTLNSILHLPCLPCSYFQDDLLDVIYWMRQIIAVINGICWGIIPLEGLAGLITFVQLTSFN